jgi:hypothetical protein
MDEGVAVDRCDNRPKIHIERKVFPDEFFRSALERQFSAVLTYTDHGISDNAGPCTVSSAVPPEYLAALECLFERERLAAWDGKDWHENSP